MMEAAFEAAQNEYEERSRDRFEEQRGFDDDEPEQDADDWFYSDEDYNPCPCNNRNDYDY